MKMYLAGVALLSTLSGNVAADQNLAQSMGCMNCHKVEGKLIGPSFQNIAAIRVYSTASLDLTAKIRNGSAGAWGKIPMPPNAHVSEQDAEILAKWILSTK
jgi:cytochrome c